MSGAIDLENLNMVDSSTYMRVAPFFEYIEKINLFDIHTYIGHGAGTSALYFGYLFDEHIDISIKGNLYSTLNLGFIPSFLYDYGLIGAIFILLLVVRKACHKFISVESIIFLFLLINANLNTQLFWYVWAMLYLLNHVIGRKAELSAKLKNSVNYNC